jgi:aspartyl-tRNA(Asn)/glutamyl-tRNA(Gln) amidotransferase subunit B
LQETRGWDTHTKTTFSLRDKENVVDYRFMRDADLPRLLLSEADEEEIRSTLTETPAEKVARFCEWYKLSVFEAESIALDPAASGYFEAIMSVECRDAQIVSNWINHELTGLMHKDGIFGLGNSPVSAEQLGSIVDGLADGSITGKLGKRIVKMMFDAGIEGGETQLCQEIVEENQWGIIRNVQEMEKIAEQIFEKSPKEVEKYQNGDENRQSRVLKYFMGASMKATKGRVDPEKMQEVIIKKLKD